MKIKQSLKALLLGLSMTGVVACQTEEPLEIQHMGPQLEIISVPEVVQMGENLDFTVKVSEEGYALKLLEVKLKMDDIEVASLDMEVKRNAEINGKLNIPFVKEIPDGKADLLISIRDVLDATEKEVRKVQLKRPEPEKIMLHTLTGEVFELPEVEEFSYVSKQKFPEDASGFFHIPVKDGKELVLGWNGEELEADSEMPVPLVCTIPGISSIISANLLSFKAGRTIDVERMESHLTVGQGVTEYIKQGMALDFPDLPAESANWYVDRDFIHVDEMGNKIFLAKEGYYWLTAYKECIKFSPVDATEQHNYLDIGENCEGSVWMRGEDIGKPKKNVSPSWGINEAGAYAFAQIAPKIYQLTLNAVTQIGPEMKICICHKYYWEDGSYFKPEDFIEMDGLGIFTYSPDPQDRGYGYIVIDPDGRKPVPGKGYKFLLDLTGGAHAARLKVEEVDAPDLDILNISVNGTEAMVLGNNLFKINAMELEKGQVLKISGIPDMADWYVDPDHVRIEGGQLLFNAVKGWYSVEFNNQYKFVTIRRVTPSGMSATFQNEGAVTIMGWGIGHPSVANPLSWDNGQLLTLAEVEPDKFQFTGKAVAALSREIGGRLSIEPGRKDSDKGMSFKLFGQAGWGVEQDNDIEFTKDAQILGFHQDAENGGNIVVDRNTPLVEGATYVMTFTFKDKNVKNGKFTYTFDCRKL